MKNSLESYVISFDDALDRGFCDQLISQFEGMKSQWYRGGAAQMVGLAESSWAELNISAFADDAFKGFFLSLIDKYLSEYNNRLKLTRSVPLRPRYEDLRMKKYSVATNDKFQPHFDSTDIHPLRYLVFLWYLNDVVDGGETEFCDLGIRVQARAGRLLMFPPYWMYQHAGLPPLSNDKYILSTYLLFQPSTVPSVR
ncbi:2OG-Fe(II) oxygenase [Metallibacterium sp.]|uniref:2OG-Fe(II) oxygenase family protein n=1 Tax=Metallibacterium sp. TaxID=2940281 RepID=UPI00260359FD|nr:2OG-Fe(II) oxygenase [Metallibacterium sp.]